MIYQQGDYLIIESNEGIDPAAIEPINKEDGMFTLFPSHLNKHPHYITDDVECFRVATNDLWESFIRSAKPFRILHQEHKPLEIPAGLYTYRTVKEFNHLYGREFGGSD